MKVKIEIEVDARNFSDISEALERTKNELTQDKINTWGGGGAGYNWTATTPKDWEFKPQPVNR